MYCFSLFLIILPLLIPTIYIFWSVLKETPAAVHPAAGVSLFIGNQ